MKSCKTYQASIFIAGDLRKIEDTCREYCLRGLCVTVTPTKYIYTGGAEDGVIIGLINYPRFPSTEKDIQVHAQRLANILMEKCHQRSCIIQFLEDTYYLQNPNINIPH